ncbi:uncharacterized protein DUF3597 [Herbaspirillum sp. SJZ107]|nr:uncharacterized protein DUF3597 [Herbaspirillum sp. SJZ107]
MSFNLGNLLNQYLGGGANANPAQAENDFDHVAQNSPFAALAQGVTQALRSDQTPPFSQMVGQMFSNGNPEQRAGMLNQLLSNISPGVLSSVAGGLFGNLAGGDQAKVSPEQAAQLSPEQVQELAAKAEQQNPGIVERMGDFYAQHPTLVKTIGGAALAVALGAMAKGIQNRSDAASPANTNANANTNQGGNNMGILGDIFHKIFPSRHPANAGATQAPAGTAPAAAPAAPQAAPQSAPAASAPAAVQQVDVEQILTNMQAQSGQQLNWRSSIVDLLKLLGLDSSLQARKELAAELNYSGDTSDSASMNIWLHRQVMNKLAANGGKVPADLKD